MRCSVAFGRAVSRNKSEYRCGDLLSQTWASNAKPFSRALVPVRGLTAADVDPVIAGAGLRSADFAFIGVLLAFMKVIPKDSTDGGRSAFHIDAIRSHAYNFSTNVKQSFTMWRNFEMPCGT